MVDVQRDPVASTVIAGAIDVHRCLGPGLLETAYQTFLAYELLQRGLRIEKEVPVPVMFKGIRMDCGRARQAFLMNFNAMTLKDGLKSFLGRGDTCSR